MPSIEKNRSIIEMGSWYNTQSYSDYENKMSFKEFKFYTQSECLERFKSLNIEKGDLIKVTDIGGKQLRNYTGIFLNLSGTVLRLQQKNSIKLLSLTTIDEIEIIESMKSLKF